MLCRYMEVSFSLALWVVPDSNGTYACILHIEKGVVPQSVPNFCHRRKDSF